MNRRIPDSIKNDILEYGATNIVQIIEAYVPLKKQAQTFVACCPFHEEKTPSFYVDPVRRAWHCFGACSEGGDVAMFIMKINDVTFPEALERLALMGRIDIPDCCAAEDKKKKEMTQAMEKAAWFYCDCLTKNINGARAYVGSRMSEEMARQFGVGYAPAGGKALLEYLVSEKIATEVMQKAGLVRSDKQGCLRDMFWSRVMFPIHDKNGRVIAFAGRQLSDKSARFKYINSPETPLFRKRATLFGLGDAIEPMKKTGEAFVVEGYIDLIQMRESKILNVVATCGTAFTREQAVVLKRYAKRLNFMFDADNAGRKAMQKSVVLAIKEDMKANAYLFPEGHDPDSFYRSGGKTEELDRMSGFDFLKRSGVKMNALMENLHRLERLENGVAFMSKYIPDVARLLARRGNLGELFSPELLPGIEENLKRICKD
jgi:DNA primase